MINFKQIVVSAAVLIVFSIVLVAARNYAQGSVSYTTVREPLYNSNSNPVAAGQNGVTNVKLWMEGYEYKMEPSTFTQGVPVRMEVDLNTVTGCMRTILMPSFNVRKTVSQGNNIIEFTPDKTGTFSIICSMNMGRGKYSVISQDGSKSDFVENTDNIGGSCGAGGGGCGCGG
jgi:plastocyanin domain-containing protein